MPPRSRGVDTGFFHPAARRPRRDLRWSAASDLSSTSAGSEEPEAFPWRLDLPGSKVVIGEAVARDAAQGPSGRPFPRRQGGRSARHHVAADVFVFLSLTDTFGNVIVEALARLPVAAYPVIGADRHRGTRAGALSEGICARRCSRRRLRPGRRDQRLAATHSWDHSTRQFIDAIELAQVAASPRRETRRLPAPVQLKVIRRRSTPKARRIGSSGAYPPPGLGAEHWLRCRAPVLDHHHGVADRHGDGRPPVRLKAPVSW